MFKKRKAKERKNLKEELMKEIKKELNIEQEKKKVPYQVPVYVPKEKTPDDLKTIKKYFVIVFTVMVIWSLLFIAYLVYDDKKEPPLKQTKKEIEIEETIDLRTTSLVNLKEGSIPLNNIELLELYRNLKYNEEEYLIYDSNLLYRLNVGQKNLIDDLEDSYLLFLLSKTSDFKEYIDKLELLTKFELCSKDGNIKIPITEIDKILLNNFNKTDIVYKDFIFSYYVNGSFITYIKFVFSDNYYVSSCYNKSDFNYNSVSSIVIDDAIKESNEIKLDIKAVFTNQSGVFREYTLNNRIGNIEEERINYVNSGSTYQLLYKLNENSKYYLYSVSRID